MQWLASISVRAEEYERVRDAYPALGYEVLVLPKVSVEARADFVLRSLEVQD